MRRAASRRTLSLLLATLAACSGSERGHPWLRLDDPNARIIEVSDLNPGHVVIVMDLPASQEEALSLGRRIQAQAPEGATVNVRIYNDEQTARKWRTAPAPLTLQHLLVVVRIVPETGLNEVRWVGPQATNGG